MKQGQGRKMDDSKFGTEDKRGYWKPHKKLGYPDVFVWPLQLRGILAWLPGYLFPWGAIYAALTLVVFVFLTPDTVRMQQASADWIGLILLRNYAMLIAVVGVQHYWLYVRKAQGTAFKYNRRWPQPRNPTFTFNNQTRDNLFWTLTFGVPIWTAWECLAWWLYANGHIAQLDPSANPIWFVLLWLLVPLLHEFHFYCVHRLIHIPWLYKRVHYIHHRNINPGPWSGLSMHPVEHLLYFSGFLIYFVFPAHPLHFVNMTLLAGLTPAQGHTGFDRVKTGKDTSVDMSYYAHYLHHRYFEVNYADGTIPIDKWFGTFHDGSPEGDAALKRRRVNGSAG